MTNTRAVIFDLDGTLADTLDDIANAMNHVLVELGFPTATADEHRAGVGWGVRHLVKHALPGSDEALVDEATARFRRYYTDHLIVDTRPYPGIAELLDRLQGRYTLAVLSNKPQAMTAAMIEEVFARWQFADVVGAREGVPRKPDPTSALALAQRLDVSPRDCVFVGDTDVDIQTATAAGMTPVGVGWGFRDGAELVAAGASALLSEPLQLLEVLEQPAPATP